MDFNTESTDCEMVANRQVQGDELVETSANSTENLGNGSAVVSLFLNVEEAQIELSRLQVELDILQIQRRQTELLMFIARNKKKDSPSMGAGRREEEKEKPAAYRKVLLPKSYNEVLGYSQKTFAEASSRSQSLGE